MLNAELRVVSGNQAGNVIPLVAGRFLIGREEDCHLRPGNDLVSRHHCVFKTDEFTVRVRDLGSTNGTFVNEERLRGEVMLNTGDKVRVGTLEFEVVIGEGAAVPDGDADQVLTTLEGEPDSSQTVIQSESPYAPAEMSETTSFQGDTVYQPQPPQYDPNLQPMYGQPAIGYQMPYPQYPYGQPYGQPYGMPMGYPQQPMPYPPMYPQPPMPMGAPPAAPPSPEPSAASDNRGAPPVSLPDPSQTGAKPPEPPAGGGGAQSPQGAISNSVTDIIKQYTQRRPGGTGK